MYYEVNHIMGNDNDVNSGPKLFLRRKTYMARYYNKLKIAITKMR